MSIPVLRVALVPVVSTTDAVDNYNSNSEQAGASARNMINMHYYYGMDDDDATDDGTVDEVINVLITVDEAVRMLQWRRFNV